MKEYKNNNDIYRQTYIFIFGICQLFFLPLIVMFTVSFVRAINVSLGPYILKVILNRIEEYPTHIIDYLLFPTVLYLLILFLHASIYRLYDYFIEIKMVSGLRQTITISSLSLLLKQSHSFYQDRLSGNLINKINDLVNNIPDILKIIIDRFFSHTLALIIASYTLWQVNVKFAVVMLCWIISFIIGAILCSRRLVELTDEWADLCSLITGKIGDILSNILSVKLFTSSKRELSDLNIELKSSIQTEQKVGWLYFWIWCFYGYSFVFIQGLNFYLLLKGRQQGIISIGDFALVTTINIAIGDFLWGIVKDFSQFSKSLGKVIQAIKVINLPTEVQDKLKAQDLKIQYGEIVFDKVKFGYKNKEIFFRDLTVNILPSQKVGLVGYSGSGKSTFVNLLLRLFDVLEGKIFIDNQDIKEFQQDSLRQKITVIPQDSPLFHRSIIENIRYGKIDASDEEVIKAAKQAYAHEFISKLPEGYESFVGERGIKLSGGQRQRIAIARAILKNAPILILDEATSQLDSLTESQIHQALWNVMEGKTTIVIAHRLSTLLSMDRILVFDQGKIIQDGSHEELIRHEGLYKKLWDSQIGGFLPDTKIGTTLNLVGVL